MKSLRRLCALFLLTAFVNSSSAAQSIARIWDEQILAGIRLDRPHPPAHARNLFTMSVAMYDAWAAYDPTAVGYIYHGKHTAVDVVAARREAISYAAYRVLAERYALSLNSSTTLPALASQMATLGYSTGVTTTNTSTPAGVGNAIYAAVSAYFLNDGSRQTASPAYSDPSYVNVNLADYGSAGYLVTGFTGTSLADSFHANHWQPLAIANAQDQNGNPIGPLQTFVGASWLSVRSAFALSRTNPAVPWIDPGPQPKLNGTGDAQFRSEILDVIRKGGQLTPDDGVTLDISPGAYGNNSLGANDGTGFPTNPVTGLPYAPNVVKRGDFARVLAEHWADGPNSETPPGHWNVLANKVADDTNLVKRIGGTGPIVDDLEWDVKVYFAMNAAVHDAACTAWGIKRYYDGARPISWIRFMGQSGQSTTPGATFSTNGLPLSANVVEVVTALTAQPAGRHAGLPEGSIAVYTWPGQPNDPTNQYSGAKWIQAAAWIPYQKSTFVTPAFPGYISGHSTFSRSAATVLSSITGSEFFPGGFASFTADTNYLTFEKGPTQPVQLQWATYNDAADQAGQSRLYGGIHVQSDDFTGRRLGAQIGSNVWALAQQYFDGSITNTPLLADFRNLISAQCEISCDTLRGFKYQLQSTTNLSLAFTNEPGGLVLAVDTRLARTNTTAVPSKFFRYVRQF